MSLKHFALVDSTLREGEQFFHSNFSRADKKEIARAVSDFGIEYIELTSPCASSGSRSDSETIAAMGLPSTILTHILCRREDADMADEEVMTLNQLDELLISALQEEKAG